MCNLHRTMYVINHAGDFSPLVMKITGPESAMMKANDEMAKICRNNSLQIKKIRSYEKEKNVSIKEFIVIRMACLQEDEGRNFFVASYSTRKEAETWIAQQANEYFGSSNYKIMS